MASLFSLAVGRNFQNPAICYLVVRHFYVQAVHAHIFPVAQRLCAGILNHQAFESRHTFFVCGKPFVIRSVMRSISPHRRSNLFPIGAAQVLPSSLFGDVLSKDIACQPQRTDSSHAQCAFEYHFCCIMHIEVRHEKLSVCIKAVNEATFIQLANYGVVIEEFRRVFPHLNTVIEPHDHLDAFIRWVRFLLHL